MQKTDHRLRKHEMKEDSFVTLAFRAQEYIQRHQKIVLLGAGAIAVIVVGIWFWLGSGRKAEVAADQRLNEAFTRVQQNDMPGAAQVYGTIIEDFGGTKAARDALYYLANMNFVQKQWTDAIANFEKFARTYGPEDPARAAGAWSAVGDAYQSQGDHPKAIEYYEKALAVPGTDFLAPGIYVAAARSALARGDSTLARGFADRLFEQDATLPELAQMRELLALHGISYTRGF
jgi:tetratricopeptide (TPR) repeat protein